MFIEFHPTYGPTFKVEIPLPLPPRYRIIMPQLISSSMFSNEIIPSTSQINYREFELSIVEKKFNRNFPEVANVVGLPRKVYREIRKT